MTVVAIIIEFVNPLLLIVLNKERLTEIANLK